MASAQVVNLNAAEFSKREENKSVTIAARFSCQKCKNPLRLDGSFDSISAHTYADITSPIGVHSSDTGYLQLEKETIATSTGSEPIISRGPAFNRMLSKESGNGFTLLGESPATQGENLSRGIHITAQLFDILSDQSAIDHPLCEECTDNLLDLLDQQLRVTENENKDYQRYFDEIKHDKVDDNLEAYDLELATLQVEEQVLLTQLDSIDNEHKQVLEQIEKEKQREQSLDEEEEKYYVEYNEFKRQALECEDEQRSAENQLKYAKEQLHKLKKTNVFNITFHIWHNGHFGTINGFRLGRLPNDPVDWNEINAAWGQTVLLLYSLANKMNMKFERYRLIPYGNYSYMESLGDKSKELPLYGSGGIKFFWDNKFDQAMVAFLDCLQQFKDAVEQGGSGFSLPYRMDKGRIEDSSSGATFSIKIQFNSEEQWTKALKFMLTNLKWGLAWVSSQFRNK